MQDIVGMTFNNLTVLSKKLKDTNKSYIYECLCKCGNRIWLSRCHIIKGRNKSCGCLHQINVLYENFGSLIVLKQFRFAKRSWATCKCKCGNYKIVELYKLLTSHTTSCGCLRKEKPSRRKPDGINARNTLISSYKKRAKEKNIEFNLSDEQMINLFNGTCEYCGREPYEKKHSKLSSGGYLANGIDRIDNNKGYTINNCVSCCHYCNIMKLNKEKKYFLIHCKRIVEHNKEFYETT